MARRTTRNVGENAMRLAGMHLMTLSDLARALGRSRQGLSNVVGGRSKPSLETAQVLADFFAVGVQDLLSPPEDCVRAGAEAFARAPARRYGRVEADIAGVAADIAEVVAGSTREAEEVAERLDVDSETVEVTVERASEPLRRSQDREPT